MATAHMIPALGSRQSGTKTMNAHYILAYPPRNGVPAGPDATATIAVIGPAGGNAVALENLIEELTEERDVETILRLDEPDTEIPPGWNISLGGHPPSPTGLHLHADTATAIAGQHAKPEGTPPRLNLATANAGEIVAIVLKGGTYTVLTSS